MGGMNGKRYESWNVFGEEFIATELSKEKFKSLYKMVQYSFAKSLTAAFTFENSKLKVDDIFKKESYYFSLSAFRQAFFEKWLLRNSLRMDWPKILDEIVYPLYF